MEAMLLGQETLRLHSQIRLEEGTITFNFKTMQPRSGQLTLLHPTRFVMGNMV